LLPTTSASRAVESVVAADATPWAAMAVGASEIAFSSVRRVGLMAVQRAGFS